MSSAVSRNVVLYRDEEYDVTVPVVDGATVITKSSPKGCFWRQGSKGTRHRRSPITAIVLHHTAGEGKADAIYRTLVRRELSVHFTIDRDGRIVQHADLSLCCFHAGKVNDFTVGIEIANKGVYPAIEGKPREFYRDQVRGVPRKFLKFTDAQVASTKSIVKDLCELLEIPYRFPVGTDGKVSRNTLPYHDYKGWRGLLGHFHVSSKKVDPSPHLLDELVGVF